MSDTKDLQHELRMIDEFYGLLNLVYVEAHHKLGPNTQMRISQALTRYERWAIERADEEEE